MFMLRMKLIMYCWVNNKCSRQWKDYIELICNSKKKVSQFFHHYHYNDEICWCKTFELLLEEWIYNFVSYSIILQYCAWLTLIWLLLGERGKWNVQDYLTQRFPSLINVEHFKVDNEKDRALYWAFVGSVDNNKDNLS